MTTDGDDLESLDPERPDHIKQPMRPRLSALWPLAMLACAVVVAIAAVIIAYQEAQQTKFQRRQDCIGRSYADLGRRGSDQELVIEAQRRCYGVPNTTTTTAAD